MCCDAVTVGPTSCAPFGLPWITCGPSNPNCTGSADIVDGCPGAPGDYPCPAGDFCPTPLQHELCPDGSFCRQGSITHTNCPWLASCPPGSSALTSNYSVV